MKVIDPGHVYELAHLDGVRTSRLVFVKREGEKYPGNVGSHEGTNIQEVLRALIDRVQYLNAQIADVRDVAVIDRLRTALWLLEDRAASRHGRTFSIAALEEIEHYPVCATCGHVGCDEEGHAHV